MANDSDIELILDISTKAAEVALSNFAKSAPGRVAPVEQSFLNMGNVIKGAFAYLSAREVLRGFDAITEAASENERALTQLNVALKLSGDFSEAASARFQSFATQLQSTTVYGDELVLQNVALAKSFNITNNEAQKLVGAAADLSAATGVSLNEAVSQLGKTFDGTAGRLNETIPALRNLTASQLQAGAAVDYVASRFKGAAAAIGETFTGRVTIAKNAFGEILETLGLFVTRNSLVLSAIKAVTDGFVQFNKTINSNHDAILAFIKDTAIKFINGLGIMVLAVELLDKAFSKLIQTGDAFARFIDGLPKIFGAAVQGLMYGTLDPLRTVNEQMQKATKDAAQPLQDRISVYDSLAASIAKYTDELDRSSAKQIEVSRKASDALGNQTKAIETLSRAQRAQVFSQFQSNPFGGLFGQLDLPKGTTNTDRNLAFGAAIAGSVTQGAAGATKLAGNLAGAGADALLPGSGAAVGPLVEFLAQGPEKVRATIKEFIDQIPTIFANIVEAIPVIAQTVFEALPELITKIGDKMPEIAKKLGEEMPQVASAFASVMPQVAIRLSTEMVKNAPSIAIGFATEFIHQVPHIIEEFIKQIGQQIGGVFKGIPGIGGGGGGSSLISGGIGALATGFLGPVGGIAGGIVGGFGDLFKSGAPSLSTSDGFSTRQALLASRGGDSSANERLSRLEKMLANETDRNVHVSLKIGQRELASEIFQLGRQGFRLT